MAVKIYKEENTHHNKFVQFPKLLSMITLKNDCPYDFPKLNFIKLTIYLVVKTRLKKEN